MQLEFNQWVLAVRRHLGLRSYSMALPGYLQRVDEGYTSDRDLELKTRSLELSSVGSPKNARLREDLASRTRAVTLCGLA